MPRTKGVEKAQIRLRIARDLVEFATGKGGLWLEAVLRREREDAQRAERIDERIRVLSRMTPEERGAFLRGEFTKADAVGPGDEDAAAALGKALDR
jgi:hypothetical protein